MTKYYKVIMPIILFTIYLVLALIKIDINQILQIREIQSIFDVISKSKVTLIINLFLVMQIIINIFIQYFVIQLPLLKEEVNKYKERIFSLIMFVEIVVLLVCLIIQSTTIIMEISKLVIYVVLMSVLFKKLIKVKKTTKALLLYSSLMLINCIINIINHI